MVLTSSDLQQTIRKGWKYTAIMLPDIKEPTEFTAGSDLAVISKGNLLELQEEANKKGFVREKVAKRNNILMGGAGLSIPVILVWIKRKLKGIKVTKKKEKA